MCNRTWKTTWRSIIALPDLDAPSNSSSHPSNVEVFPKGSIVLGLYPETTSFYRATVREAPRSQSGGGGGARRDVYLLEFIDDGQQIHQVEKDSVARVSTAFRRVWSVSLRLTVADLYAVPILISGHMLVSRDRRKDADCEGRPSKVAWCFASTCCHIIPDLHLEAYIHSVFLTPYLILLGNYGSCMR